MIVEIQALDDSIQNDQSLLDHLAENDGPDHQEFTLSEKEEQDEEDIRSQRSLSKIEDFSLAEDELSSKPNGLNSVAELDEPSE
mmetsp:Transcript_4809/g.7244  ORF Transcript_4809/g.7244 Transcript_4809/m.7244 type:complete len:84 (+) Transcript_4809:811-1062(+)